MGLDTGPAVSAILQKLSMESELAYVLFFWKGNVLFSANTQKIVGKVSKSGNDAFRYVQLLWNSVN